LIHGIFIGKFMNPDNKPYRIHGEISEDYIFLYEVGGAGSLQYAHTDHKITAYPEGIIYDTYEPLEFLSGI